MTFEFLQFIISMKVDSKPSELYIVMSDVDLHATFPPALVSVESIYVTCLI